MSGVIVYILIGIIGAIGWVIAAVIVGLLIGRGIDAMSRDADSSSDDHPTFI